MNWELLFVGQGNLYMSLNRPEGAVAEFKIAQDLRADIRSYQGFICQPLIYSIKLHFGFYLY